MNMKEYKVKCFFTNSISCIDTLYSMRVLLFRASDSFVASSLARDFLQSHSEDLEILGCLDKLEIVEVGGVSDVG